MKTELKSNKGITLIALVITIIVLLILAGVSIAMLTGENGLLTKASDAKQATEKAGAKEAVEMEVAGSFTNDGTYDMNQVKENLKNNLGIAAGDIKDNPDGSFDVTYNNVELTVKPNGEVVYKGEGAGDSTTPSASVKPGEVVTKTEKNNYTDTAGKKATVPAGFTIVPGCETIDGGLVISDNSKDTEKAGETKQALGNQFVWIPVVSAEFYKRDLSYPSYYNSILDNTPEGSTFTDTGYLPSSIQPVTDNATNNENAERQAVINYNGFYIGRYEAGKEGTDTIVCKNNVPVYNNISQTDSKAKAKELCSGNPNVECALCSGIQWDMVMKFVDGKNDAKGKKFDVRVYDSTRHTGSSANTGLNDNDKVQNIYDLEGNCYEYVAEKNNISSSFINRGGDYSDNSRYKASERGSNDGTAYSFKSFRSTLYIK